MTDTTPAAIAVDQGATLDVLLAEYKAIKDEQRSRIDRREHLVYWALAAAAATLAAASRLPVALLLLPAATVILGWTHLVTDVKISAAGRYLREDLTVRLGALAGTAVLGWEHAHRGDPRRRQRKSIQLAVDLGTFPAPALVSLGAYLTAGQAPLPGVVFAVLLAAAAVVLAGQQALYAAGTHRLRIGGRR
jgi:hypothetical protein